jgi:hypothetical protein
MACNARALIVASVKYLNWYLGTVTFLRIIHVIYYPQLIYRRKTHLDLFLFILLIQDLCCTLSLVCEIRAANV